MKTKRNIESAFPLIEELEEPWRKCRDSFVAVIKDENFYRDQCGRWSLKQHWSGPTGGFQNEMLQRRWLDFKLGWDRASNA